MYSNLSKHGRSTLLIVEYNKDHTSMYVKKVDKECEQRV